MSLTPTDGPKAEEHNRPNLHHHTTNLNMVAVAVAGGLGDFGRLIVDALLATGKHEVYCLSRRVPENTTPRTSPSGKQYNPIIQTDYSSEQSLTNLLTAHNIHTVISVLFLSSEEVLDAQTRLINAAAASSSVKRFIPSEYNVNYDLPDSIFPYPKKKLQIRARRAIERTDLEYTYIYPGFFMDYFGLPRFECKMSPMYFLVDLGNDEISIPGNDGSAVLATTLTSDVARYIAAAVDLEKWPSELKVVGSEVTMGEFLNIARRVKGNDLKVRYDSVEQLTARNVEMLTGNLAIAEKSGGGEKLKTMVCDLEASVALGAYDLTKNSEAVDLVTLLDGKLEKPTSLETFLEKVWLSK